MPRPLPFTALAAALALAACNQAPKTTDNSMVDVGNAEDMNAAAFNDQAPLVEDAAADDTPAIAVVEVPRPASNAPAADNEPLVDASAIEDEIRAGTGIERIRYGDGWAWRRNGVIIRTADRNGRNTAYFRRGESTPFFAQRGDRSFSYRDGRPARVYDHDGRAQAPDAGHKREADDAARDARNRHDEAERAHDRAANDGRANHPGERPHPPVATPSPQGGDHHDRQGSDGGTRGHHRPDATPTPTPTPSPSPTPRWRHPERRPDRGS